MAVRINTGMQNRQADHGGQAFDGGAAVIEFRTGAQPASANDAATGTLLATLTLPADAFGAAAAGVAAKAGTWQATVVADGTPGYARMRNTGDTLRMDFSVSAVAGGGDCEFDDTTWVTDGTVVVDSATLTQPAS